MAFGITRGLKQTVSSHLSRVWKIGRLVFVSVPPTSFVAIAKQVLGVGYMATHLQQKNPFHLKKNTHTHIQCQPRQKISHKTLSEGIFSSSFRRKTISIRLTSSGEGSISLQNLACSAGVFWARETLFVFVILL